MSDHTPFEPPMFPPPSGPTSAPGPSRAAGWYRRRFWKLPVWAWAAIVVFLAIGAMGSATKKADKSAAEEPSASATSSSVLPATATAPPTTRAATTTQVTTTLAPTTTQAPTTTAPPQPIVLSGSGDSVVNVPSSEAYVATISHRGRANFVVWALDANLGQTDLLVNEIGNYDGRVPVSLTATTAALQIQADGNWTISLLPLVNGTRPVLSSLSGVGSDVLFVNDTAVYSITHGGQSNFVIWVYTSDSVDLAVNEIGNYSGAVPIRGPGIVVVQADGAWTITKG